MGLFVCLSVKFPFLPPGCIKVPSAGNTTVVQKQTEGNGEIMQGKVEICGVNTASLPRLSSRETEELLARAGAGDLSAREQLIRGNLRLVLSVIQKFSGRGENVDDLFQVGCVGLIKAIDNFDPSHEVKFSTYGVPMIYSSRKL